MKKEMFLKKLETKKGFGRQVCIEKQLLSLAKRIKNNTDTEDQNDFFLDVIFCFDTMEDVYFGYDQLFDFVERLNFSLLEGLVTCMMEQVNTKNKGIQQRSYFFALNFWANHHLPLDHFLWAEASTLFEYINENSYFRAQGEGCLKTKLIASYKHPQELKQLAQFPCKIGMLQAASVGPDDVFEQFRGFEYSTEMWGKAVVGLMDFEMSLQTKYQRLDILLDDKFIKKAHDDLYDFTMIYLGLEGLGMFDQSQKIKSMTGLETSDNLIFYSIIRNMPYHNNHITEKFFQLDRYNNLIISEEQLSMAMTAVMKANKGVRTNREFEQQTIGCLNEILTTYKKNFPEKNISRACLDTLKKVSSVWFDLPKNKTINRLLDETTLEDKKAYLQHCGKDTRVKLVKKLSKTLNIEDLREVVGVEIFSEQNKIVLLETLAKKEKDLIQQTLGGGQTTSKPKKM